MRIFAGLLPTSAWRTKFFIKFHRVTKMACWANQAFRFLLSTVVCAVNYSIIVNLLAIFRIILTIQDSVVNPGATQLTRPDLLKCEKFVYHPGLAFFGYFSISIFLGLVQRGFYNALTRDRQPASIWKQIEIIRVYKPSTVSQNTLMTFLILYYCSSSRLLRNFFEVV